MLAERARVLITVKAAPEPSKSYRDTVCVAGLRVDVPNPSWIRLYPVPYRHLADSNKFAKFQVVELDVNPARGDVRAESRRPVLESIHPVGKPLSIQARGRILEPLVDSMCAVRNAVLENPAAPSLALVRARDIGPLRFEPHGPWTDSQASSVLARPDLFDDQPEVRPLEPPRFKVWYDFRCDETSCPGHVQRLLDWELGMLERHYRQELDVDVKRKLQTKFVDELCGPSRAPHFFVGNYASIYKRKHFSVLGVYSPPQASDYGSTLF